MITLDAKLAKAQNILENKNMITAAMPVYMDLRGFENIPALEKALAENRVERDMFCKFVTATVVALVCDKARAIEGRA